MIKCDSLLELENRANDELFELILGYLADDDVGEDFVATLGGSVFVLEDAGDLSGVPVLMPDGSWSDLSRAAGAFDAAHKVGSGEYYLFFLATNNAGGPTYFIPKAVVEASPETMESLKKTNPEEYE